MNKPMNLTRPADPARLSPVPCAGLAPPANEIIAQLLALLLLPALAFYFFSADGPQPDWAPPPSAPETLLLQLLPVALLPLWLAALWEQLQLLPSDSPLKYSARGLTLRRHFAPAPILATGWAALVLLLPLAVALLNFQPAATARPWLARLIGPGLALVLLWVLLALLNETRHHWHHYQRQKNVLNPAAHALPARTAPRPPARWDARLGRLLVYLGLARTRHRVEGDELILERRHGPGWQALRRWPLAAAVGFYADGEGLWLAGRAGGEDVALAPAGGRWERRAEALSAASGLPVLYRWPAPPAELFAAPTSPR